MRLTPLLAMVRKDLQLFFTDRRAVIMSFAAPIAIASFLGAVFPGQRGSTEPARVAVHIVAEDGGAIAKTIVARVQADTNLAATVSVAEDARRAVRRGKTAVAVIIPKGFGDAAGRAFFAGRERPELDLLYDPSHSVELGMVRGLLTEHVMQAVSEGSFGFIGARS
jgi:ABC-2 type transport system permease protein